MKKIWVVAAFAVIAGTAGAQAPTEAVQAIRNNDLAALKAAISKGAVLNVGDSRGTTLLMEAAAYGSPEAIKLLLDSGANPNAKNQFGSTALTMAADQPETARMLVERGADVKAATRGGRTPIMIAAHCDGCSAMVKLLLDKGADPKAADARKRTALLEASEAGDLDSMKLLLAKGVDADPADVNGMTPLLGAAASCNLEGVKLLVARKANPNAANLGNGEVKFGKIQLIHLTPLMLASASCSTDVVRTLLDAGAKVNEADIRGMTPLMFAVSSEAQSVAVVKMLLDAGANVNAKSTVDETALDWAEKSADGKVIATLTAAGAKQGVPYEAPKRKPAPAGSVGRAVERSTALLQSSATEFFHQSGCVGCHHQPAALLAVAAARSAGVKVDESAAKQHIKVAEGLTLAAQELLIERYNLGGTQDPWTAMLMGMGSERYPATPLTDMMLRYITSFQHRDGSWWFGGHSRAPSEEGHVARTALALRAMQLYSTPGMKSDLDRRIARAKNYLLQTGAATNDEAAMQILGLYWAGGSDAKVSALAKLLLAAQQPDGGWSQRMNLASDAYATGETLWALTEVGALKVSSAAYQKGAKFLLDTQWSDGSWYVRSRAPKFQPYFQSGFPFDHDQWISAMATSMAVRGLAPSVELEKRASQ